MFYWCLCSALCRWFFPFWVFVLMKLGWPIFLTFVRIFANSGGNFAVGRLLLPWGGVWFLLGTSPTARQMQVFRASGEAQCCRDVLISIWMSGFVFWTDFSFCFGFFAPTLEHITVKVMRPERGSKIWFYPDLKLIGHSKVLSGLQPWPASVVYPCHSYYSLLTVVGLLPFFLGASSFALGRPEGGLLPVAFSEPGGGLGWGGLDSWFLLRFCLCHAIYCHFLGL